MIGLLLVACGSEPAPQVVVEPAPPAVEPVGEVPRYVLSFPEPHTHYLEVDATLPASGPLELMMAVWTPGSYLVREYAQHVEGVTASGPSGPLPIRKTAKNRWLVEPGDAASVAFSYRVYARRLSVQGNFVDADMAVLNGAPTFIVPVGVGAVDVLVEPAWPGVATALPPHPDGDPHHFRAPDLDALIDTPVVMGTLQRHAFAVHGVPHELVNLGGDGRWDQERSARDVARIVETQIAFWGAIPYDRYLFLNAIAEAGGGLEHEHSTLMITSRWATGSVDAYRGWLGLVSHEFFHTWNVKRLRPVGLGPFDYEREVHTPSLWVAEGLTSYYDDLLLRRAGLVDDKGYLKLLSKQIRSVEETPGREVQALSEASFDAWIKFYRKDENRPNTTISYYRKGAVVGWLLDAEIRRASDGARTLDGVLRALWAERDEPYTPERFRAVASEVAGTDLGPWLAHAVDGTGALDFEPALAWFGLRFAEQEEPSGDDPLGTDPEPGWLGLHTGHDGGRLVVRQVRRGTPGYDAGVNVGDELVALDGFRIGPRSWDELRAQVPPGSSAELLVSRRGRLRTLAVELGAEPDASWSLEVDPDAEPAAKARRERWLGGAGSAD